MAYVKTGVQALFPVYLPRPRQDGERREEHETCIAQNENNLNQNLSILYAKLCEMEEQLTTALAGSDE
ncbi:MAG: hypothetical protein PHO41_01875 [Eubacteriales bacterium]|nr:hypothetical protein [Eubacteriales bacterium]